MGEIWGLLQEKFCPQHLKLWEKAQLQEYSILSTTAKH